MKVDNMEVEVAIPKGVSVTYKDGEFSAVGKAGTVTKVLKNPKIVFDITKEDVILRAKDATRKEKMHIHTFRAHVRNIMKGAQEGFTYKLRICSGHFPMSAKITGTTFELKNFLGEAFPRKLTLKTGAKVTIEGEYITVQSPDKELAGQVSADLEKLTRITNRDRRIFQDGIYIVKKGDKDLLA
jgi:large subunit ribosomal protein L6